MKRNISIKKANVNCVCDSCGINNFEKEMKKEEFFLLNIKDTFLCLCPDCLSSLSSLISPLIQKEERKEEEEREKEND